MYLYISKEKLNFYYTKFFKKQIPQSQKIENSLNSKGTIGSRLFGGEVQYNKKTESTVPTSLPEYLENLLNNKKFSKHLLLIPNDINTIGPGTLVKCSCEIQVTSTDEDKKIVAIKGIITNRTQSAKTIIINLSCGLDNFSTEYGATKVSSISSEFVTNKKSLMLLFIFIVSDIKTSTEEVNISGSPLFLSLPSKLFPWDKWNE